MNASGNTAVVWSSQMGCCGPEAIFLQRFDGAGARVGAETRVDSGVAPFLNNYKRDPAVAMDDAGNIFVVWAAGIVPLGTQYDYSLDPGHIYGQRFDAAGTPQGSNILVNTNTRNGPHEWPSVAMFASGEAVVAWSSFGDGSGKGIFMQRFDASGTRLGVTGLGCFDYLGGPAVCDTQVNTFTAGYQAKPRVAANTGVCVLGPLPVVCTLGDFVVVWEGAGTGDDSGIFAQVFSGGNGLKSGVQFMVNTYTSGTQELASVSMDAGGNFIVTWIGEALPSGRGVFGQRFGIPSGPCPVGCAVTFGPLGPEFQIASLVGGSNHFNRASVGKATTGGFVVVWNDVDNNSANDAIFGRDYDGNGAPLGSQFQVSEAPPAVYYRPAAAMNPAGQFLVTWEGGNDGGGDGGIWARRFGPATPADTTPPVITPNISGTLGTNDWYTSTVSVTWTVTDPESPITSAPCVTSTVTTDTAGVTFTCTATSAGGTSSVSRTIKRDASPPSATLTASGTLGTNGWYVSDVTVSTSGADTISSPVTCTAAQTLTIDTAGQNFSGSCTNAAGLSTTAPTLTVKRDVTPPSATLTASGTLGSNGWYRSDVTVSTIGADTISSPVTCTAPQTLTTETSAQIFSGSCTNAAGLATNASPLTLKLDKTAPTISISAPTNGASYDLRQPVAAAYACADARSGLATCIGPVASGANIDTASAGGKTFTVTAVDAAGNSTTQSVGYDVVACHYLTFTASPSTVLRGGVVRLQTTLRSCEIVAESVQVRFTLSAPAGSSTCFALNPMTFTGPSFVLPPNTQQSFAFPIFVPFQLCPGTYVIKAETLVAGRVRDTSTAMIVVR
jgi:hypothetical protein